MKILITSMLVGVIAVFASSLKAGIVAQEPLFLGTTIQPNVMFLLDDSGSMNHIVADSPYDDSTTYACIGTVLSNSRIIVIRVQDDGDPYFRYNGSDYDWVSDTGTGITGRTNKGCFDPAKEYEARLYANRNQSGYYDATNYSEAKYSGNYLNWYFGFDPDDKAYKKQASNWGVGSRKHPDTQRRTDIAKTTGVSLVNSLENMNVGLAMYSGSDGANIRVNVKDIEDVRATLVSEIQALSADDSTPLAESLHEIGRYFKGHSGIMNPGSSKSTTCAANGYYNGDLILHPDADTPTVVDDDSVFNASASYSNSTTSESPICYFCQNNFVVLMTDGVPTDDRSIPTYLADYDGDCVNASPSCNTYDQKQGQYYGTRGSDYLDDVAKALYEIDLRPDIDDANGNEVTNNLVTYVIGFADDQVINDPLMQDTADNGGGKFLRAANASALVSSFSAIVDDIKGRTSTASAVTTNTTRLNTDSEAYRALFNSSFWSGDLLAIDIEADGSLGEELWNAAEELPAHSNRNIYSWSGSDGFSFEPSQLATINATASAAGASSFTSAQVDFLRGDRSEEEFNTGGTFRTRSATNLTEPVLGDIVNSNPLFVSQENFGYHMLGGTEGSAYTAFRKSSSYQNRKSVLYVGANDGMLHAFDTTPRLDGETTGGNGEELFAYIPNAVYSHLHDLHDPDYGHRYYVDGSPHVGDAYIDHDGDPDTDGLVAWRSVLVGSTGAGGSGVFALDVTTPSQFTAEDVLWEVNKNVPGFEDLGYTIGDVTIALLKNGEWYAIFGNGYNSSSGKAAIYMVNLEDPGDYLKFDTGTTGNGMSSPLVVDSDGDYIADRIYAGDLKGSLWKLDVNDANTNNWKYAFGTKAAPKPLFTAEGDGVDGGGNDIDSVQPITAKPQARKHPLGGLMIYFGTGKYFETIDSDVSSPEIQSFYGIRDFNGTVVLGDRDHADFNLVQQLILDEVSVTGTNFDARGTTNYAVDYATADGWYMDLKVWDEEAAGERVVNTPILRGDRVIFTTLIPSPEPCGDGGKSWLMELDALDGSRLEISPFDLNNDNQFNSSDYITIIDENGDEVLITVSGLSNKSLGIFDSPAILTAGQKEIKILSGSSGESDKITESAAVDGGRQGWQQLK